MWILKMKISKQLWQNSTKSINWQSNAPKVSTQIRWSTIWPKQHKDIWYILVQWQAQGKAKKWKNTSNGQRRKLYNIHAIYGQLGILQHPIYSDDFQEDLRQVQINKTAYKLGNWINNRKLDKVCDISDYGNRPYDQFFPIAVTVPYIPCF